MKVNSDKLKLAAFSLQRECGKPGFALRALFPVFVLLCGLCGCAVVDFVMPDKPPYYRQLWETYNSVDLKVSTSAEVLAIIGVSESELVSQSKSVIASLGQKKTYHIWLNMVAFDDNSLMAKRKYLLVINEKPKVLFTEPWDGVTYDSQMLLEREVLDEPYADDNARRIAILTKVLEIVRKDVDEVSPDNKMLGTCGMIINQALEAVLVKLKSSPAEASRLSEPAGLKFEHISLDKGRIQMLVEADVVKVKMMLGSFVRYFQKRQELGQTPDSAGI